MSQGYLITTATRKLLKLQKRIKAIPGGCLAKGTKVLMFNLAYKNVEDIVVGELLMGPDSKPRKVLNLYRGASQMYTVHQKKGLDYTVNDKHILVLEDQGKEVRGYKKRQSDGKEIRTYKGWQKKEGFHKFIAKDFFEGSKRSTIRRYKGIKASLDFRVKKILLDPYYLGLWLGDGCSRTTAITNIDSEVLQYLFDEIPKIYDVFAQRLDKVTTKLTKRRGKYNDIMRRLIHYDLILNKHIPIEYIRNSRKIRLQVLAGLIDSDGCLAKDSKTKKTKGYYITQKRKRLAEDILLLCRTLGYYATLKPRISKMKRKDGSVYECPTYTVAIFAKNYTEIPVKIARKKCLMINSKNVLRSSIWLEKMGEDNYYGFELDRDHLFLLEDFTITHNTSASKTISILQILIDKAQRDPVPKLTSIVSETLPHLKRGAIRDFLNIMETHNYYRASSWNRTDFVYTFESGSKIEFFGVDNQEKVKGPRRDRLFINEANNIDYNSFDQLEVRTNEEVWMDWNPTNEFWYYTELKGKRDDIDELTLTYLDNEACPDSIKLSIESRKHRTGWWRVYGLGQLGEVEGRIYSGWRKLEELPHEARLECYGLDFGYHPDPCVIIAIYYYNGGYILDEIFYKKEASNHEVASFLKNQESKRIIADCAEPKSIDEIKKYGVSIIPCRKGKDSKRFGIKLVQGLSISVTKQSVNLWKEYQNYLWFMDRNGNFVVGETDGADDCLDAARYGLSSVSSAIDKERTAIDLRDYYGNNWSNNNPTINPAR